MVKASKSRTKKAERYGYDSIFPTQLRALLDETGTTQDKLAESLEVSRQAVSQWQNGKTMVDLYYLKKISEFFDVSYEYLLDGAVNKKRENVDVGMYLGLTDDAINTIHTYYNRSPELVTILNELCTRERFWATLSQIVRYWKFERGVYGLGQIANEDGISPPSFHIKLYVDGEIDCDQYIHEMQNAVSAIFNRYDGVEHIKENMAFAIQEAFIDVIKTLIAKNILVDTNNSGEEKK